MPQTFLNSFLGLVEKSGLLTDRQISSWLEQNAAVQDEHESADQLAARLVADSLLTHFQAEQLLAGKWRGFHVGKYRILERLGSGGMGAVYLARHQFMKRRVAIKILPRSKAADHSALTRFYREARAAASLDDPNIVRAFDIDKDGDLHFIVMEFVEGSSLQQIVQASGPQPIARSAEYIAQAARGLEHAHDVGLVHRDIKPGNLMVDLKGNVKILDMGLALFFDPENDDLTIKFDGNVIGTADYLSPEQATDSHNVDIRSDIYSLGCTLYYLLSGKAPFDTGTTAQKLIWHQTRRPVSITDVRSDIPEEFANILARMMHKDPQERFQLPGEVAKVLTPWAGPPTPPLESEMPRFSPMASRNSPSTNASTDVNADTIERTPDPVKAKSAPPPRSAGPNPKMPPPAKRRVQKRPVRSKPAVARVEDDGKSSRLVFALSSISLIALVCVLVWFLI